MTIEALEQDVKHASEAYELECLLARYNDNAPEVIAALDALNKATFKLNRAKGIAKQEREHAESCRIAAAMEQAPTEAEALEILRKANEWVADMRADAAVHAEAAAEVAPAEDAFASCPEDDDYAGLPNEDGINEDGQNVFHPGAY